MIPKKYLILLFVLTGVAQLAVPISMVYNHNSVLENGTPFKIKTIPIDPNDPFRGKYIVLRYRDNKIERPTTEKWEENEKVFVSLSHDDDGYGYISDIGKDVPNDISNYIQTKVSHVTPVNGKVTQTVWIDYPFDRFYMEESKAPRAEKLYNESTRDTSSTTCALLMVADGRFVLKDVLIDGVPIADLSRNGE